MLIELIRIGMPLILSLISIQPDKAFIQLHTSDVELTAILAPDRNNCNFPTLPSVTHGSPTLLGGGGG